MKAGRELDALIETHVFGNEVVWEADVQRTLWPRRKMAAGITAPVRRYSEDIAAAWEVVERFEIAVVPLDGGRYWAGQAKRWQLNRVDCYWEPCLYREETADTAPHAICLAALKAKGVSVPLE